MDSEIPLPAEDSPNSEVPELAPTSQAEIEPNFANLPPEEPYRGLRWVFIGDQGLRGGWSVLIFAIVWYVLVTSLGFLIGRMHLFGPRGGGFTPTRVIVGEFISVLGMLGAAAIVALIERRRILDYNLTGPRRTQHFFSGIAVGFAALSLLIGLLAWGGWLHFGGVALSGIAILRYALLWGLVFLLVGCFEEGMARCYLQFTLTRSINFWWALGLVAAMCVSIIRLRGNGVWGVYAMALLGVFPCIYLHQKPVSRSDGFWYAAWVTSTFFGWVHTSNGGENWIGIFSAAAIGFVFCVSIWVTGSAWWAIGCHAGWDWAETYFYGTANSGVTAQGHYLTASPVGNPLWSGGSDGPEGSVLIIGVLVLLLAWLLAIYRRKGEPARTIAQPEQLSV